MLIGHQKQWHFLKKSAELGRLPHALLFYGQEHLGKKALAIEFSKFLIGKTSPPDFILIEPKGKLARNATHSVAGGGIQIAQIRNLIQKLSFKPYLADFKIAVIDNAHLMTHEAQNCFLKFLEEPKDKTYLILITACPSLLLSTILSRVQKIRFFPTKGFEIKNKEEFISDLIKISESELSSRFQYAKDVPADNLEEILDTWLRYFRSIFLARLARLDSARQARLDSARQARLSGEAKHEVFSQYSLSKLKNIIKHIQSTNFLISSTNINPRLALEILLMKL